MSSNIGGDRPLRVCDLCGGVDDHPRHSFAGTIPDAQLVAPPTQDVVDRVLDAAPPDRRAELLAALFDQATTDRHLDCCAAAGCPLAGHPDPDQRALACGNRIAGAEGKTGRALLNHLTKEA